MTAATMMVQLTQGYEAIIDADDCDCVSGIYWGALICRHGSGHKSVYASGRRAETGKLVLMHRLIMGLPDGEVDHRDGNGLNNMRSNLRIATRAQNAANRRKADGTASRFKGVSRTPQGLWRAYITPDGRQRHLGIFDDEEAAARAYDVAAIEIFGEFARTNLNGETICAR